MDATNSALKAQLEDEAPPRDQADGWYRTRRGAFVLLVIVPTLLVLFYTGLIASSQYNSKAAYIIRGMQQERASPGGLAELFGGSQALGGAPHEAQSIRDYLQSPDAIAALKARGIDLVALYHRDDADIFSKLRFAHPRAETLLDYYRDHVHVDYNENDGITRLSVRAFAPADAKRVAEALIALGEARVNAFNSRAIEAGKTAAEADLVKAESELSAIQGEMTQFRDVSGDIDPAKGSDLSQKELERVSAMLIGEQANLETMRRYLASGSPLVIAARDRIEVLQRTANELRGNLTGGTNTLDRRLARFEQLKLRQGFAAKRYDTARAALETARVQAERQRLFFVPVVTANLPEKPSRPTPLLTSLAVLVGLAVAFAIGWLLLAGVREHQA